MTVKAVAIVDVGPNQVSRSVEVNAPAAELFAIAADPRRHHELDGTGTVRNNLRIGGRRRGGSGTPPKLAAGASVSPRR